MKYLDEILWIEEARKQLEKQPLSRFKDNRYGYVVPILELTYWDLEAEVYPDGGPLSIKKTGSPDEHRGEEEEVEGDLGAAFEFDILPAAEKIAAQANKILGGEEFFICDYEKNELFVLLVFTEEEIPLLQEKEILSETPTLSAVLAQAKKAFAEFEGPLFERAKVDVEMKSNPEDRLLPDPTTARLALPDITPAEAERIPRDFQITVKESFEDDRAIVKSYSFTFQVTEMTFEPKPNGMVRPRFKAELKEYRHA